MPDIESLKRIVELVRCIIFPGYFESCPTDTTLRECYLQAKCSELTLMLNRQISAEHTHTFMEQLPTLTALLHKDVDAMVMNDPAVDNRDEVIYCYPVVQAMLHYRVAHVLHQMHLPILPRIITEQAHSLTGIDIHPGAEIGEYFAIDHGTGVVIGATCIIGNHVTLYQGVTLGAKNFHTDANGQLIDEPRHPIIEDNVTIYSNTSVLGRITIGHDSVIGGNVWLTHDVPPHSHILQANYK